MFAPGPEGGPEPDIIGTADRARPRRPRYVAAGCVLALAGIIAATAISLPGRHAAAGRPGGATASPARPAPVLAGSVPPLPDAVPSQAWVTSLNIADWPMPGSGSDTSMFGGGVAGNGGWELTARDIARPGRRCVAAVVLHGSDGHSIAGAYPISPRPATRTPVGDLAFITLGAQAPGVGVGFLQLGAPGVLAWFDPRLIGGLEISASVVTVRACGQRYYLAGFAYPLAGTLDIFLTINSATQVQYLVPTRLSRPRSSRVWHSTG